MPERYFTKAAVVVAHQIFLFFIYCSITVTYCSLKQKRARGHYCEILPTKHWCGSSNTVFIDFQVTSCNISNFIYIMLGRGREKKSLFLISFNKWQNGRKSSKMTDILWCSEVSVRQIMCIEIVATPTSACWCCFMKTIKRRTAHSTGLPKTTIVAKRRI